MNTKLMAAVAVLLLAAPFSWAGGKKDQNAVSGLLSLDEAIEGAAVAIEGRVAGGSEIAVYKITASHDTIGDYLAEDLNDKISMRGNLVPLARGAALQYVDTEHEFQMSGMVRDESAVGIGHYLGAKVVITGTFDRYADFSQFRLRAINVETSALLYSYMSRINNKDRVLANITAPLDTMKAQRITENALAHLNKGKDLFAENKWDEAIAEFDKALAINKDLAEAYYYRGSAYIYKGDFDKAITDNDQAIRLNPNYVEAYSNRGFAYAKKGDNDRAIADLTQAIRIDPNFVIAYTNRANISDDDQAIADYTQAIRINPNLAYAYYERGTVFYMFKMDYDRATTDFEAALRLDPSNANYKKSLENVRRLRGMTALQIADENFGFGRFLFNNGDDDQAIKFFTQAIRLNPNFAPPYEYRALAYYRKGDIDRAIADFEAALRINPNNANAREALEAVRRDRGR
jgi:tetratricopeptide (TPR) repeat protein